LLDDFDGIEIAAAALQLVERERRLREAATAASPVTQREPGSMARASDFVGAIANQGGVSGAELGKVDVRESHTIVEVSAKVADAIIERVTGTEIKGRRAIVRRDESPESRPARGPRDRGASDFRGERGAPRGPRGDRGDRGERGDRGPRGDRPSRGEFRGPRSDRGDRGERGDRGDRGPRGPRSDRPPRPPREDRGA
jgi:ATP-dependent RNA helicase DeaD